jgi:hypothetical protein
MLRLIRLERRIARLEARAARRAAARRRRGFEPGPDPRQVLIEHLDRLARQWQEADAAAGPQPGWGRQSGGIAGDRTVPPAAPGPEPMFPNAEAVRLARLAADRAPADGRAPGGAAVAEGDRPHPPLPSRPFARPCEAPGAVPCGLVCRLRGGVDCRLLARRGLAMTAVLPATAALALGGAPATP